VERLSLYRRKLEELNLDEVEYIHSHELAALVRVTPAQLRRDLASFGSYGNIARGYEVRRLSRTISEIIGTDTIQNVALVGVGDLGRALLSYRGFEERGFHIAAAFDVDPEKVGRVFAGRRCYGLEKLEATINDLQIRTLILTARKEGLQDLVDRAVGAGVRAYLNFVPTTLHVPEGCFIEEADISARLEKLSFLTRQEEGPMEDAV
jgi:redox-sensing transcriptional repressor